MITVEILGLEITLDDGQVAELRRTKKLFLELPASDQDSENPASDEARDLMLISVHQSGGLGVMTFKHGWKSYWRSDPVVQALLGTQTHPVR